MDGILSENYRHDGLLKTPILSLTFSDPFTDVFTDTGTT